MIMKTAFNYFRAFRITSSSSSSSSSAISAFPLLSTRSGAHHSILSQNDFWPGVQVIIKVISRPFRDLLDRDIVYFQSFYNYHYSHDLGAI